MKVALIIMAGQDMKEALERKSGHFRKIGAEVEHHYLESPGERESPALLAEALERVALKGEETGVILSQESIDMPSGVLVSACARFTGAGQGFMETPHTLAPFPGLRTRALFFHADPGMEQPGSLGFTDLERQFIYEHYFSRPHFPDTVFIEATNRCNLHCVMCPCHGDPGHPPPGLSPEEGAFMTLRLYDTIIDELAGCGKKVTIIPQFRGESCLHPQFTAMLGKARNKGLSISLNTNATCIDDLLIESIIDSVDSLFISLDAVNESTFERVRRGACYSRVTGNVKRLLERRRERRSPGHVIYASFVLMDENRGELDDFLAYWHDRVEGVMVYQPRDIHGTCRGLFPGNPTGRREPCYNMTTSAAIMADGRVVPCCNDNTGLSVLGTMPGRSLHDIYNGDAARAFRLSHARGAYGDIPLCSRCDIWRWHHGSIQEEEKWVIHENPPSRLYVKI